MAVTARALGSGSPGSRSVGNGGGDATCGGVTVVTAVGTAVSVSVKLGVTVVV
jgi:hypothetical protein